MMGLPAVIGTLAIARSRPRRLMLYIPAFTFFLTGWRKFVCARCDYYGKECSTYLGVLTAKIMPPARERPLDRNAMWRDFAFMGALILMPLRDAFKSRRMAVAYLASLIAGIATILVNGCGKCSNDFCPMKDARRKLCELSENTR